MDVNALRPLSGPGRKLYIETYGCQMNVGDSEIVLSILQGVGYRLAQELSDADVVLINTCSVRDNAEQRIWSRLRYLNSIRKRHSMLVGVIGCMAERLKDELHENGVDIVAGPDSYRRLPSLLDSALKGIKSIDVELSLEETYDDIQPVRMDKNGVSGFISIMRGCNNFCSYCVVPYTRGRERSRSAESILEQARILYQAGYREITLLGQNVNSYCCEDVSFAKLLGRVADIAGDLRVRFATSHPKDLSDELIEMMASKENICKAIHLPAQSGSDVMLQRMNRKYTREWYLERVSAIRRLMPQCAISTDLIAGFSGETLEDHQATLSLMREVGYSSAFMFKYSLRPGTFASRHLADDVPEQEKVRRLNEIIALQNEISLNVSKEEIGKTRQVLIEGDSKRSSLQQCGRTSQNRMVVFDSTGLCPGSYVNVRITDATSATLFGCVIKD
ncbi:MAG: tRNA (N6-isopentenyl adenosine(37)-C2)-methylthiotransferase MiaB [Alistipes sp.]|nr:tRNA (N6-isopentenyl adenosine(37)-C2)-methylthiotransferase MiaB [Candidatus Alistipes equi]